MVTFLPCPKETFILKSESCKLRCMNIISSRNCRSISKRSILTSLVVGFTLRNLVLYDIDEAQISSVYYSLLCDTGDLVNFQKKVCTASTWYFNSVVVPRTIKFKLYWNIIDLKDQIKLNCLQPD